MASGLSAVAEVAGGASRAGRRRRAERRARGRARRRRVDDVDGGRARRARASHWEAPATRPTTCCCHLREEARRNPAGAGTNPGSRSYAVDFTPNGTLYSPERMRTRRIRLPRPRPGETIELGENYRRAIERLESLPENQSGADKTWVERRIFRVGAADTRVASQPHHRVETSGRTPEGRLRTLTRSGTSPKQTRRSDRGSRALLVEPRGRARQRR